MERSMDFIEMLLDLRLERKVPVADDLRLALVVASDARVEPGSWPGGGALILDLEDDSRWGGYLEFAESALAAWGLTFEDLQSGKQPIQLCEAAMVPLALMQWPGRFRVRRMVWYVDNTSAMASFVEGASANEELDRIVGLFWMLAWHLEIRVWFEWVDSESNWSDGVSRSLASDSFAASHGFSLEQMRGPTAHWKAPWRELRAFAQRAAQDRALGGSAERAH